MNNLKDIIINNKAFASNIPSLHNTLTTLRNLYIIIIIIINHSYKWKKMTGHLLRVKSPKLCRLLVRVRSPPYGTEIVIYGPKCSTTNSTVIPLRFTRIVHFSMSSLFLDGLQAEQASTKRTFLSLLHFNRFYLYRLVGHILFE